eukprot:364419-Chlamydomonas_euryale.AAC.1
MADDGRMALTMTPMTPSWLSRQDGFVCGGAGSHGAMLALQPVHPDTAAWPPILATLNTGTPGSGSLPLPAALTPTLALNLTLSLALTPILTLALNLTLSLALNLTLSLALTPILTLRLTPIPTVCDL